MTDRSCAAGCGAPITRRSKTGFCRACACRRTARDPQRRARTSARLKEKWRDPVYRVAVQKGATAAVRGRMESDPAFAERLRRHGRWLHDLGLHQPHLVAGSDARRRMGETRTEAFLGWCPAHLRSLYRALRNKHFSPAEARALVTDHAARRRPDPATFEGQLQLLREGRRLVERRVLPRPDHPFTLGGVSAAMV